MMMMFSMIFLVLLINMKKLNLIYLNNIIVMVMNYFLLKILLMMNFMNLDYFLISYMLGLSKNSLMLIMLTLWIVMLILVSVDFKNLYFMNLMLIMLIVLILSFMSMNLLFFYFSYEVSVIPIFLLIYYWGVSKARIESVYMMMYYMLFFSVPFLMVLMTYMNKGSLMFIFMEMFFIEFDEFYYFLASMIFLVKLPMYTMHWWLLKAHVEAPFFGSMILAAVLLKLGGYGLIKLTLMNLSDWPMEMYISLGLYGSMILSLVCMRQVDIKMLVAYSSVVHMNFLMSSMMCSEEYGMLGSYLMLIAHGLSSSAMFYLVNVIYVRTGSRLFFVNKGFLNLMPSMSLMWFLVFFANLSMPLTLNLLSEILMINVLMFKYGDIMMFLLLLIFVSSFYSIYMLSYTQHGFTVNLGKLFNFGEVKEYFILLMHWLPLILMFFSSEIY